MFGKRPLGAAAVVSMMFILAAAGPAAGGDIRQIWVMTATERYAGTVMGNFFEVTVLGDGIRDASVHDLGTDVWYSLDYDAADSLWRYRDDGYSTVADLYAVHPNPTNLMFYFNRGPGDSFEDAVLLGYARAHPEDYAHITFPTFGQHDVPDDPTFTWELNGYVEQMGMAVNNLDTDVTLFVTYPEDPSVRSWTPGLLEPSTRYALVVGVWDVTGGGEGIQFDTLHGDTFAYFGVVNDSNLVDFTTNPEPGTLVLIATGFAAGGWRAWKRRRAAP